MERNSALSTAAAAAWRDFLSNKPSLAAQRAAGWLHALPAALQSADDADALVALADLAHMAGAARDDAGILAQALAAYDAHLILEPDNLGALRMRAETQLRLRDYAGAFGTFGRLHAASLRLQLLACELPAQSRRGRLRAHKGCIISVAARSLGLGLFIKLEVFRRPLERFLHGVWLAELSLKVHLRVG